MERRGMLTLLLVTIGCEAPPPPPAQPIPFDHSVHAGKNQIGCTLCHAFAEHAPSAGVPSMARCVGCHKFVDKEKPDVQAILKANEEGRVIEWNRVHRLPDHVYFTHERHVAAGVGCQECHGAVETMAVVRQVAPLTMGWCVDCHVARGAPLDCLVCHK
jgi:hypothetical protein